MSFLYVLERMRTPFLTDFFSVITDCGDEIFFMALAITVFWCVSKRDGYYILLVGFLGTIGNQFLKLIFRIPRPWVLDPAFTVVESARAGAGGYSFPSGHTQNIVGTMTSVLLLTRQGNGQASGNRKRSLLRAAAVALMILVPFSRMYLGCHTPLDVGVSFVLAVLLAVALYSPMQRSEEEPRLMGAVLFVSALAALTYWAFVVFYPFPADIDPANLHAGVKNAYTLIGCLAGLLVVRILDERYLHFPVKAAWWAQMIKVVVGLCLLLAIRTLLKAPLQAVLPEYPATAVRYFLMVLFAGAVWPLTFHFFS